MSNDTKLINQQEPYFKMSMEKKTGKYPHVIVKVDFLCPPADVVHYQDRAYKELKHTAELLTGLVLENDETSG